jgi:hypothetical protein
MGCTGTVAGWLRTRCVGWVFTLLASAASGCGTEPDSGSSIDPVLDAECASFDSTFEALQTGIFEGHGCTSGPCHGEAASGGLDLRADVAYANLIEKQATGTRQLLIQPGAPNESYLYLKLRAAVEPGSVEIANSPMPFGLPPLSANELEAIRLWITAGAPDTGVVGDSSRQGTSDTIAQLLDVCLPAADPIDVRPLTPPAADEGVQFVSPPWLLERRSEREICIATYYDFSEVVPAQYQSEDGSHFYINGSRLRQDPGSHHWILSNPALDPSYATDPSFGSWTCRGGGRETERCDPLGLDDCGEGGLCASELKDALACTGFGPATGGLDTLGLLTEGLIENVQAAQQYLPPREGVYRELPIRGFLYHNTHAFNLTDTDHVMDSRLNVLYAKDRRQLLDQHIDYSNVFLAEGIAPFTEQEVCADHIAPEGAEMIRLTSHTHKRGKRFTVTLEGQTIYENLLYSDPLYREFEPGLVFGPSTAERTLRACALYNNGVAADGSPDPQTVTRLSTMPARTTCEPVACTSGKIGAACAGADDHAACDSEAGAGDGVCDACAITGGPTTENEMFVVMPWYVLPEGEARP